MIDKRELISMFKIAPAVLVGVVLALFAQALVVGFVWNFVVVSVFPVSGITIWQSLGLLVLARILFSGWPYNKIR